MFLRVMFYTFWANACCNMAASLLRALLPQMNLPSTMPTEITQLGPHGVIGPTLFEISFAVSYAEIVTVYTSWMLTFVFTVNDLTEATK